MFDCVYVERGILGKQYSSKTDLRQGRKSDHRSCIFRLTSQIEMFVRKSLDSFEYSDHTKHQAASFMWRDSFALQSCIISCPVSWKMKWLYRDAWSCDSL